MEGNFLTIKIPDLFTSKTEYCLFIRAFLSLMKTAI